MIDTRRLGPHCAHGNLVELLHLHAIGDKCPPVLVRLPIVAHPALFQRGFQLAIMLVCDQVGNGLAKIPQEPVARFGAIDHMPRQNRHPGQRIIAAQLLELRDHVIGPILRTGLPAIVDDVADASFSHEVRANRLLVTVEVVIEILLHKPAIQLIHFEAGSFRGRRMVGDPKQ